MHQDAGGGYMVYVFGLDLKVVDGLGAGAGDGGGEAGGAVEGAEAFAGLQFVGAEELLAVFAPEGVVGRGADRFVDADDLQVEDLGRGVAEGGGDDAARAGRDGRAGPDGADGGIAVDVALGD